MRKHPSFDIDELGALCPDNGVRVEGSGRGPLRGLTFAVKDVFDVAGSTAGNGHPAWLSSHAPAARTAVAVQRLLDAGANLTCRTISDELAYSLTGENFHYGTPLNPVDPTRIPGGSSSGAASVTAAGAVDFALGSDCGGSVRLPASYCGILGMRPSHGCVPLDGVSPFAPSFDTTSWFARDPRTLERVGRVLLANDAPARPIHRLVVMSDAFESLEPDLRAAVAPGLERLVNSVSTSDESILAPDGLDTWSDAFRTLQAAEVWHSVGDWVEREHPRFGPGVGERLEVAKATREEDVRAAQRIRDAVRDRLDMLLPDGTALVMPTVPRVAPERGLPAAEIEIRYRHLAMNLLCAAGLGGLPQISLPLAEHEGLPLGLSVLGRRGADVDLMELACRVLSEGTATPGPQT